MIDTQRVKERVNLLDLVGVKLKRIAGTGGGEYAGPCPFCGGRDRFHVQPDNGAGRWMCRQCGGEKWHDAIEFVQRRDGVGFVDAVKTLYGDDLPQTAKRQAAPKQRHTAQPAQLDEPPGEAWQYAVLGQVIRAADNLWSGAAWLTEHASEFDIDDPEAFWNTAPAAAKAFKWLTTKRGLTDETLRRHVIGFNPDWVDLPDVDAKMAPGVVIPCWIDHNLWYVKVRTFRPSLEKYLHVKGSTARALFNADGLMTAQHAIVCEGELDALLIDQESPDGLAAVTMGSAGSIPGPTWAARFAWLHGLWLMLDQDDAGQAGQSKWAELVRWARSVPGGPGPSEDATDYYRRVGLCLFRRWIDDILPDTGEG